MNLTRREFLYRLSASGIYLATPKIIFDLGKNKDRRFREKFDRFWNPQLQTAESRLVRQWSASDYEALCLTYMLQAFDTGCVDHLIAEENRVFSRFNIDPPPMINIKLLTNLPTEPK